MLRRAPWRVWIAITLAGVAIATVAEAQFRRGFSSARYATDKDFDGGFHYCRLVYGGGFRRGGGSWTTDYPNADINMSIRLSELTKINVSRNASGQPNHLLVRVSGDELFQCPLVIMSAPGSALIENAEAARLREYLLKGGMLWTDDSWGTYQWEQWVDQLRKVLPAKDYPIFDLPLDHALFRTQFEVTEIPQIPNIGFFLRTGGRTSEQGADSAVPHLSAIADGAGRLMVLMTHNTDIQDSWEREGEDPSYFYAFSPRGYALGINAILYALTH
ncbi:MAG: DUF4159 domain-containing protein [Acidobacteria bacterium]|nr:DUF4159 domain-containing protein [Acidobacteriota bacterium]